MTFTFDRRWLVNATAAWAVVDVGACSASKSAVIFDHNALGSFTLSLMVERQ